MFNLNDDLTGVPGRRVVRVPGNLPYFDITTFCQYVNVGEKEVKGIANNTRAEYKTFFIDKDTNKIVSYDISLRLRRIDAPSPRLKRIQLGLCALFKLLPFNDVNYGFINGKHMRDAAEAVSKGEALIHADAKDFFPSHSTWFVAGRLEKVLKDAFGDVFSGDFITLITKLSTLCGQLPQGSPCSPILTVILNKDMDDKIKEKADAAGLTYVRYVDDLVFSGAISNRDAINFLEELQDVIHPHRLNWKKCGVMRNSAKPICLGFTIHSNQVMQSSLQAKIIKKIKGELKKFADCKITSSIHNISVDCKISDISEYNAASEAILTWLNSKYRAFGWSVKRKFFYIQSVKTVLGMHVDDGKVNYPRKEFNKLRLEAMLMGIQRALQKVKYVNESINSGSLRMLIRRLAENSAPFNSYNPGRNLLNKPMNRKVFNGKVAYVQSVTPKQGEQLKSIEDKFYTKMIDIILTKYSSYNEHGNMTVLKRMVRR